MQLICPNQDGWYVHYNPIWYLPNVEKCDPQIGVKNKIDKNPLIDSPILKLTDQF